MVLLFPLIQDWTMKRLRYAALVLALAQGLAACGESDTMGVPTQDPIFPNIDQAILDANCIRGTATFPAIRPGNLNTTDCATAGTIIGATDDGYYEGYRVRVTTSTTVDITVQSQYDSFLDVLEYDIATGIITLRAFDDDSGGNFQPLLTFTLQPDIEYWVMVSGLSAADVGTYTLNIS